MERVAHAGLADGICLKRATRSRDKIQMHVMTNITCCLLLTTMLSIVDFPIFGLLNWKGAKEVGKDVARHFRATNRSRRIERVRNIS
jgi:hypothetical protein